MPDALVIPSFTLECGAELQEVSVAYTTWGSLNAAADNAVIVGHSLTSTTDAAQWWRGCIGPGAALDTDRYFVVCPNVIGSPYGSVSPISVNPETGRPYGLDLPQATVRDAVALHKLLLDRLGVRGVAFAIGGSMGGMQGAGMGLLWRLRAGAGPHWGGRPAFGVVHRLERSAEAGHFP